MFPVLFSLGPLTVSSFGFFLALAFLFGTFLAWRLSRAWELDEEKVLDLCLLTFFGGLVGARLLFVALNFQSFADDLFKIPLLTKYPGLSFWGAIIGGTLTLFLFVKRIKKMNFWQVADLAGVGVLGGLVLGNIGCLLGGCNVGVSSNLFFALPMVGFLGKRFPLQILEGLAFAVILFRLWPVATHFHFTGKIISLTLISLGLIEILASFLREGQRIEWIFPIASLGVGMFSFYFISKRSLREDLLKLKKKNKRRAILNASRKSWYNQKVAFRWTVYQLRKKSLLALRRKRVKPTPNIK
jgi:phosphatidylglycerol---prolipoprotein diacylglyceryl transferase